MDHRPTSSLGDRFAPASHLVIDDMAHFEAAVPGLHVSRLDRGRSAAELTLVGIDDIRLCVGRFDFKVASEGGIGPDESRIALQLEAGSGSWNGSVFDRDRLWVYGPGAEHAGAAGPDGADRGTTWATFTVPVGAVARADGWDRVGRRGRVSVLDTNIERLRRTIHDVVSEVDGRSLTVDRAHRAGRELREAAAALLLDAEDAAVRVPSAYRITQRCLAVADDLEAMPTTAELAARLDLSDRWVRAAFDRVYGVSVSTFFRSRSLHRARRVLATADPTSTSVAEISMACGFWHLGRFAGYYRAHFGEHPRTTLHRAA